MKKGNSIQVRDGGGESPRFSAQVREVINRNTLVSLALTSGYNAFLPVYDGGTDFILYNEGTGDLKKVQLKGRWTIDRKYLGLDIWIAFQEGDVWYLAPHDEMVQLAETYGYAATASWLSVGTYCRPKLSRQMRSDMEKYQFPVTRGADAPL